MLRQQLQNEFTTDGSSAPDVGSVRKWKSPPGLNDPSVITNGLSNNIQQIAASINGLVGVARQSQQTQEVQLLHIHRKELEDTIEYLEVSSMELEMKICDKTGTKKKLLGKALLKKTKDLKTRKNVLAETMKLIEQHHTDGTPSVMQNSMPCFVGIAQESDDEMDGDN